MVNFQVVWQLKLIVLHEKFKIQPCKPISNDFSRLSLAD